MNATLTRRRLIRSGAGIALTTPLAGIAACGSDAAETTSDAATTTPSPPKTAEAALERLLEGNRRYVEGAATTAERDSARRAKIAEKQAPFATVLGCADSRVPPETIFDQGLGDLFVVRVAGNTAAESIVVGSVEYATEHVGTLLVVVLGHQRCGAVTGAVEEVVNGHEEPGEIAGAIAPIVPVVERVRHGDPHLDDEELVEHSIAANVEHVVDSLNGEALLANRVDSGEIKIVGAEYELESGEVKLL